MSCGGRPGAGRVQRGLAAVSIEAGGALAETGSGRATLTCIAFHKTAQAPEGGYTAAAMTRCTSWAESHDECTARRAN